MEDDLEVRGLFIPLYDYIRYYTNEKMTEWDDINTKDPVMILLEKTVNSIYLKKIIQIGRVFVENKVRYVYLDDLKIIE